MESASLVLVGPAVHIVPVRNGQQLNLKVLKSTWLLGFFVERILAWHIMACQEVFGKKG